MRIIVITPPHFIDHEPERIASLLNHGVWAVHLRKPDASAEDLCRLLDRLSPACRSRIVLHDHFPLCRRYALKGIHLNRRNPVAPPMHAGSLSVSVHSLEQLSLLPPKTDYAFLSPIFDSISKQGYQSAYTVEQLTAAHRAGIIDQHVFALGGVSLQRLPEIKSYGFGGAALLGDVWQHATSDAFTHYLQQVEAAVNNL